MSNVKLTPDVLFEVSWEVCNKIGGIHTVIATKAETALRKFGDHYLLIGPDLQHEGVNPEFEEDSNLLRNWRQEGSSRPGWPPCRPAAPAWWRCPRRIYRRTFWTCAPHSFLW